jgi:hypothetical protein
MWCSEEGDAISYCCQILETFNLGVRSYIQSLENVNTGWDRGDREVGHSLP